LRRISADAGAATAQVLADAPDTRGGAWSRDNVIIFAPNIESGLYRIPATGGEAVPFTHLDRTGVETTHRWPQFLPDGRTVIFLVRSSALEKQGIYTATLDSSERKLLFRTPYAAVYSGEQRGGSMFFADGDILMSRPFDPRGLTFSDEAKPVTNLVVIHDTRPHVSAAPNGTLIYQVRESPAGTLTWHDRSGTFLVPAIQNVSTYLRVSPDDRYAVTGRHDARAGSSDIWILDLQRGTETRLTSHPATEWAPIWSPDAARVVFNSNQMGSIDLFVKPVTGGGADCARVTEPQSP
jgi:serine/threonine-protein kinase